MQRSACLLCLYFVILSLPACTQSRPISPFSKADGIRTVGKILADAKASGSLEYSGRCDFGTQDFPNGQVPATYSDGSTIALLTEVFRGDPQMRIRQDAKGFVRMVENDIPQDLLNVRIRKVEFKAHFPHADSSYNAWDALLVVLDAPEVRNYMRDNRIGSPYQVVPGMRSTPSPTLPHLSDELNDLTVSEALDYILKTFPGFWTYQDCVSRQRKRMVAFAMQTR